MKQGGWLYKCGHFHPSDFVQIAQVNQACDDCRYAEQILEQAKHLRRRKVSASPVWSVVTPKHVKADPIKRTPDCKMNY